jgi:predicted RNA-binding protein
MRRTRTRIQPYIDMELAKQLDMYCGAAGTTESAVVQDALRQYLDRTGDAALILGHLARLGRAEERTKRDVEILAEAFGTWVEIWFAHTPNMSEEHKSLAGRSAARRYVQFVEHVARRFSGGHRFLDDMPQEPIADEAELTRLVAGSESTRPGGGERPA